MGPGCLLKICSKSSLIQSNIFIRTATEIEREDSEQLEKQLEKNRNRDFISVLQHLCCCTCLFTWGYDLLV